MCKLSDNGMQKIANELRYWDPPNNPKLVALNIAGNDITDIGAKYIAAMLRTNRSLQSVVLTANKIQDEGALLIIQELCMSALTHEEIVDLRRRRFIELESKLDNQQTQEIFITERTNRNETLQNQNSTQSFEKTNQYDSKMKVQTDSPISDSTIQISEKSLDSDVSHPFMRETVAINGCVMTSGNLKLQHLSLSFNRLTNKTLKKLVSCLYYQNYMLLDDSARGLLYVFLEDNDIQKDEDWSTFQELLRRRRQDNQKIPDEDFKDLVPVESEALRNKINVMISYKFAGKYFFYLPINYFIFSAESSHLDFCVIVQLSSLPCGIVRSAMVHCLEILLDENLILSRNVRTTRCSLFETRALCTSALHCHFRSLHFIEMLLHVAAVVLVNIAIIELDTMYSIPPGKILNPSLKSPLHRVFVYGTLKRGEPNHGLIKDAANGYAKFLGLGRTTISYPLVIATKYNIPFLLKKPGSGNHVLGEIYDVDSKMLTRLDELEEHPTFYERTEEELLLAPETTLKPGKTFEEVGELTKAWIYFLPKYKPSLLEGSMYASYSNNGSHGLKYCEKYVRDPSYNHRKEVQ
ncbi:uncharacterized protein [Linepithema humile]